MLRDGEGRARHEDTKVRASPVSGFRRLFGGFWETTLGAVAALLLMLAIYLGSNGLDNFDSALIGYAAGIVSLASRSSPAT